MERECPTCRGFGYIAKGKEELVALIPVSDSRLKPRKTVLYVVISILMCTLIASLLLFFLVSRTITLSCDEELYEPVNLHILPGDQLYMKYQVPINISNENYVSVNVDKLQLSSLLFGETQLNISTNNSQLSVPMRGSHTHYVTVELLVGTKPQTRAIVRSCQNEHAPILWKMFLNFEIEASISYLSHTESSSITLYNRKVCCHVHTNTTVTPPDNMECVPKTSA